MAVGILGARRRAADPRRRPRATWPAGWTSCPRSAGGCSRCRSGSTTRCACDDPDFDLDFHLREATLAGAGRRRRARPAVRRHRRAPPRPPPPALAGHPGRRPGRRAPGADPEVPPLPRRRRGRRSPPSPGCSPTPTSTPLPGWPARGDPSRCPGRLALVARRAARPPGGARRLPRPGPAHPAAGRRRSRPGRAVATVARARASAARRRGRVAQRRLHRRTGPTPGSPLPLAERQADQGRGRRQPQRRASWPSSPAALRGYLADRDELPDRPLLASVPVSARAARRPDPPGRQPVLELHHVAGHRRGRTRGSGCHHQRRRRARPRRSSTCWAPS